MLFQYRKVNALRGEVCRTGSGIYLFISDIETASKQPGDRNSAEVVDDVRKEPPNPHPPDIAKPVEGLKSDHQNDIKRDKIDKGNNSAKEIAGGDSGKLAEANKENVKLAEANKAKVNIAFYNAIIEVRMQVF